MPHFYQCQRCTACCRWPGQVRITEAELSRLAEYLRIPEMDFVQECTRLRLDRQGLALAEKPNGECVFLEGQTCRVHPVRPQQCRDFPNAWNFTGFEKLCGATLCELDEAEYLRALAEATGRLGPVVTRVDPPESPRESPGV